MKLPCKAQAEALLKGAEKVNPGIWVDHCRYAAQAAAKIAARVPGLDPDKAYVMGLLHDVGRGRQAEMCHIKHVIEGYKWMNELGYADAARICYTHSFPVKNVDCYSGQIDCSPSERADLESYLTHAVYDDYDRLIQLCDSVSAAEGFWLIEKRLFDVGLRYGFTSYSAEKWRATLSIKQYFDQVTDCNIYTLLPNIKETTFGY